MFLPLSLLVLSNVFMTFAWYGHLRNLNNRPIGIAIVASWGIAFFEYCFAYWYMGVKLTWNYLWAGLCLMGAVFFIFRGRVTA